MQWRRGLYRSFVFLSKRTCARIWHTGKTGHKTLREPRPQDPMRTQDLSRTQNPMRTQNFIKTQDPRRTQDLRRTQNPKWIRNLWGLRALGGLRTLWEPRILWGPRILWEFQILLWPRKHPGTYKLAKVSWFPHHVLNLVEFRIKGRFIYYCWMQINLTYFVKLKICEK